ncbi:AraC family transcriptional regulator [Bradyrhizobium jicamae]|uniref:AraC family transcriptional regulator n=1 Tax=Bradyrhizobium jicamae TaxID=280332 RepID=UPI001BA99EA9|nr:AraC family transcriptional regulator [Bradyrhizobium jicamae]MBR0936390.1 helix-turn-helix transcriptional regulator [Bradyrhizobium jicamae]
MGSAGLMAIELGCRGAAVGLSLLIAGVLLRDRGDMAARLSAALVVAVAASAVSEAPGFPRPWPYWGLILLALSSSGAVLFWLWARATFDDDFVLRPWHGALLVAVVSVQLFDAWPTRGALRGDLDRTLSVVYLGLAIAAAGQTLATWRADLVAGRRRLRVVVLLGAVAYSAAAFFHKLWPASVAGSSVWSIVNAFGLLVLLSLSAWSLFQAARMQQASILLPAAGRIPGDLGSARPEGEDKPSAIDRELLRRLQRLMSVERAYRREGLTIGSLSAELGVQEYRLRQLINEGLGHRNFNAFLNRYRIDEAKAALADPKQRLVPVLTIAMDAGFQSVGPFNRAFKAATDVTPTEFRRLALARHASQPGEPDDDTGIGQPD